MKSHDGRWRSLHAVLLVVLTYPTIARGAIELERGKALFDLTRDDVQYWVSPGAGGENPRVVAQSQTWRPIRLGRRWELVGHPELQGKTVWMKLSFRVPVDLKRRKIGFFATAVGDEATFYVNEVKVGDVEYHWGARIPGPTDIDLSRAVKFGNENVLLIEVRNLSSSIRCGGILGNVLLYQTLPVSLSSSGNIVVHSVHAGPLAVRLNLGASLLSRGGRTEFSQAELAALAVPPSLLREDELILVHPAREIQDNPTYRVELNAIQPATDRRPLHITCNKLPEKVGRFEQMTLPIHVEATFDNPFNPEDVKVEAIIHLPSGKLEAVSAFFGQEFRAVSLSDEEEILLPVPGNPWKLYYRPREVGEYSVEVLAQDRTGMIRIDAGKFHAYESGGRGFLRIGTKNPRFFEFDNGDSFYGTGPSGWFRGPNFLFGGNPRWVPIAMMKAYYARKKANGSNYEYLGSFHYGQLYLKGGFIDQQVAWKLEQTVRAMEDDGIYWVVFYDDICRSYPYGFDTLPYSASQGGPAKQIEEVYFNDDALQMQRHQLRYVVSRISDSPAILEWNCGDESQPVDRLSRAITRTWLKELQGYIRSIDVYEHPQAIGETLASLKDGSDVVHLEDWYLHDSSDAPEHSKPCTGLVNDDVAYNECLLAPYRQVEAPVLNIEGGISEFHHWYYLSGEKYDQPEAVAFHNHLWLSLMLRSAVGGTEWLCNVIDRYHELYHAAAMQAFVTGEPLATSQWREFKPEVDNIQLRGYGLATSDRALLWVQDKEYTWIIAGVEKRALAKVEGATANIPVAESGEWQVEFWDTRRGVVTATQIVSATGGVLSVRLPAVEKDIALKCIRRSGS